MRLKKVGKEIKNSFHNLERIVGLVRYNITYSSAYWWRFFIVNKVSKFIEAARVLTESVSDKVSVVSVVQKRDAKMQEDNIHADSMGQTTHHNSKSATREPRKKNVVETNKLTLSTKKKASAGNAVGRQMPST